MSQQPRIPESVVQAAYPGSALTLIGLGGQSDVWRSQSAAADEALRIIVTGDGARLAQEVTALQSLSSPYLMRFHALESIRYQGNDLAVVRGEFIDGGTVADRIVAGALPEPLRESCRLQSLRGWGHDRDVEEVFARGS